MSPFFRHLIAGVVTLGGALAIGASAAWAAPAATTSPPATAAATTAAPPAATTAAPPAATTAAPPAATTPTPTTLAYEKSVAEDCKDYPGNEELAQQLSEVLGEQGTDEEGSRHLVVLAQSCGVLFKDGAKPDEQLERPRSNLENAVKKEDDPDFTTAYDVVTANAAQAEIVQAASTAKWYELNPELAPKPTTTVPGTTSAPSTTGSPATTDPDDDDESDDDDDESDDDDEDSGSGASALQMLLLLAVAGGAGAWGVMGAKPLGDQVPEYEDGDVTGEPASSAGSQANTAADDTVTDGGAAHDTTSEDAAD